MKLTVRETAVFAMLGALMYASKMIMEVIPNVHLLGMFIVAFTVVYRKKALYPKIPDKYLADKPASGSVIFGKDHRTKKTVFAEPGHHSMIVGSTGSGKTATCIIPTILTHKTGSAFIVDLKSR